MSEEGVEMTRKELRAVKERWKSGYVPTPSEASKIEGMWARRFGNPYLYYPYTTLNDKISDLLERKKK